MKKLRCVVLDDYQGVATGLGDFARLADRVETNVVREHVADEDALVGLLAEASIVVVMRERTPLPAAVLARLPNLRLVVTSGMRNASIDLDAARARGVVVSGTASASEPPVELTWALLLALARNVTTENAAFRGGGDWQSTLGADLHQKTLGLLGLGKIGSRVAKVGRAFGMRVLGWSPNLDEARAAAADATLAPSKDALFAESDFVSLHLVASARTRGIVGERELGLMKPTAYLVNTSRASLVDGDALVSALRRNAIAGAAMDVFDEEPLPRDHELRALPNLLATPHLGYVTMGNYRRYFGEAVEDIEAFLSGAPIRVLR